MLTNKKELKEIKDSIIELEKNLKQQSKENKTEIVGELKVNSKNISEKLDSLEKGNKSIVKELEKELNSFQKLNEQLKKKIDTLDVIERKALAIVTDNAKEEIKSQLSFMKELGKNYKEIEATILKTNTTIGSLREDILEFKKASMEIKKMDFSLMNYTKELRKNHSEIERLKIENNKMSKLLAKERNRY